MRTAITITAVVGLLSGLTTTAGAAEPLRWRACGEGVQCADVRVPLDWAKPHGPRTSIGLAKIPAQDQANKLGPLVANLGGPGGTVEYVPQFKDSFAELTKWFDVIIFDPRGFGASQGVTCPTSAPIPGVDWFPDRSTYESYAEANRRFAEDCTPTLGPLRDKLNSWQSTHDLDAIRVALGQRELNYYGNSYGTVYGQNYAQLFGDKINRMYLDSVFDHSNPDLRSRALPGVEVTEANLHHFAKWAGQDPASALRGKDVLATWDRVIAAAQRKPIPAPGAGPGRTVSVTEITWALPSGSDRSWPAFAKALAQADTGDATLIASQPRGGKDPDLSRIALCSDFPYDVSYDSLKRLENEARARAPRAGWREVWPMGYHCAGLPKIGTYPPKPIKAKKVPPALAANGRFDQATPPEFGKRVAAQLPGARYLSAEGGHALYWGGRNKCVRDRVHRYLVNGELPAPGTHCAA
ncbi:alpha/beta hydrolase [Allokutzneria sp. A3M-2-11 16]|uniref:alpha/beta hydrolase n=1 Tax=Allokutzneria sp. A3M-2-11 16 TaxID=2962043 RepID=UPI0020B691E2|nr:alpha/beta hydrolase [Allokutzneria sp. A3M-2-11 16]MCP3800232.1 alpha/beta hydrolase [Allokutzneria sp. A3M-2-11 16]